MQFAIAAFALPIALFAIERAPSPPIAAAATPEVLARESGLFPILVFALLVGLRIGHDALWFPSRAILAVDYVLFGVSVALTIWAFYRVLRLTFNPGLLHESAKRTVRERLQMSMDESIEIRLANNHLFRTMDELDVGYWPFGERPTDPPQFLILRAPHEGQLRDIHLSRLRRLIENLPRKVEVRAGESPVPNDAPDLREAEDPERALWIMKRYGEPLSKENLGFLRIDSTEFRPLSADALEQQLAAALRIEPT